MKHQDRMELQLGGYGVGYRGMCRFRRVTPLYFFSSNNVASFFSNCCHVQ